MIRRPPRSTQSRSSAASDVYKRQVWVTTEGWVLLASQRADRGPVGSSRAPGLERLVGLAQQVAGVLAPVHQARLFIAAADETDRRGAAADCDPLPVSGG